MNILSQFRAEVDDFMQWHPESPLDDEQRDAFEGLAYYPENPDLAQTVAITRLPDDEPLILMETSTGDTRHYRRWATFDFTVDDETATLTIYSDPAGGDYFLPFRDATNGDETYGAGRYLDNHRPGLRPVDEATFAVDFNYAYNPYCAYSPAYSCPLPPRENWVTVPVRAGEKAFRG
jgi:uncharacterized protein (DUF1684 family)